MITLTTAFQARCGYTDGERCTLLLLQSTVAPMISQALLSKPSSVDVLKLSPVLPLSIAVDKILLPVPGSRYLRIEGTTGILVGATVALTFIYVLVIGGLILKLRAAKYVAHGMAQAVCGALSACRSLAAA